MKLFNGVFLNDAPIHEVVDLLRDAGGNQDYIVVTPNVDHFQRLDDYRNKDFIKSYKNADLFLCDSRIIKMVSFFTCNPIKYVVPGSDLTKEILNSNWINDHKIMVVGPSEVDIDIIRKEYRLKNMTGYCPPMGFINDKNEVRKCIEKVDKSDATMVFLAIGSPQQEIIASMIKDRSRARKSKVFLCVGASFDFLSGKSTRAPLVMQKCGLEWLHRMFTNPKRLVPRYFSNFRWILKFICIGVFKVKGANHNE